MRNEENDSITISYGELLKLVKKATATELQDTESVAYRIAAIALEQHANQLESATVSGAAGEHLRQGVQIGLQKAAEIARDLAVSLRQIATECDPSAD